MQYDVSMAWLLVWIVALLGLVEADEYSYSPQYMPSPVGTGVGDWGGAYAKAKALVQQMTLVEMVNLTTGTGWQMEECVGQTGSVSRLGIPGLCLQDSPLGVRYSDNNSAFPPGVQVASTWDRGLMYQRGLAMGREFAGKGVHVQLGPVAGPLGRAPAGGRNWEGFSPDPYLTGVGMYETILGIQDAGTMACAKHFVGNEQEHFRQTSEAQGYGFDIRNSLSSNMDDRQMHELYAWPFMDAVKANVASFMCSYQQVNNSHACQNSKLMNGLLKSEWAYPGFVMSDWGGTHSGVASVLSGLDMTMAGDGETLGDGWSYLGSNLTLAVLNGSVPESRIVDMATRITAAWYLLGQDSNKIPIPPNFNSWTREEYGYKHYAVELGWGKVNDFVDVQDDHWRVVRDVSSNGIVLLKNEGVLPLGPMNKLGVFGMDARADPDGINACDDRGCDNGTLGMGWGSGTANYPYMDTPYPALKNWASKSGVAFGSAMDNTEAGAEAVKSLANEASVAIVFVNADSGETFLEVDDNYGDRKNLTLWQEGEQLISRVVSACNNTIVVIHSVGPVLMEEWVDHANVTAVVWAGLPGQEAGQSLVDVLSGALNPSGRLPFTIARHEEDYSTRIMYEPNAPVPQQYFSEGLLIDYRAFDAHNITPRYEFGYGLSYTSFSYSNLNISALFDAEVVSSGLDALCIKTPASAAMPSTQLVNTTGMSQGACSQDTAAPKNMSLIKGFIYPYVSKEEASHACAKRDGNPEKPDSRTFASTMSLEQSGIFDGVVQVQFTVTNTGPVAGQEVAQLYLELPPEAHAPPRQLRDFTKVSIPTGGYSNVTMTLDRRDLSVWDVVEQRWKIMPGTYAIHIGSSSRRLQLYGTLIFA